jgi:O-methyltransferase involved in polyketide biosynthesis
MRLLKRNAFDVDLPTYLIWEGNTMYLPFASIRYTLAEIRTHVTRFRVSFDYMADAVITKTTGDPAITKLVDSFTNMGAPWVSGIRDVRRLAHELGLNVIENFATAELYRRYWPGRPMLSPIFNFYSLCTIGCC